MTRFQRLRVALSAHRHVLGINRRNIDHVFRSHVPGRFRILDEKIEAKRILQEAAIPVPTTLHVIEPGAGSSRDLSWLDGNAELVIKPARGAGGRGILVLERHGELWFTPGGSQLTAKDVQAHVEGILSGIHSLDERPDAVLVEERIHPHAVLADLYPRGLPDIRVVLEAGRPLQAMLRVPSDRSDGKANLHGGGIGVGVDVETGRTTGAVCQGRAITEHPDTRARLIGVELPHWDAVLAIATRCARAVGFDYVGVDIVIDRRRGPLVLEVNARPGLAIQIANGEGQPVSPPPPITRGERLTQMAGWMLIGGTALMPLLSGHLSDVGQVVKVGVPARALAASAADSATERVTGEEREALVGEELRIGDQSPSFDAARNAAEAGDTARAMELYRAAAADTSVAPFALNNIALIHRQRGQLDSARASLGRALVLFPDYARGRHNLALILRDLDQLELAEAEIRRALDLKPSNASGWRVLGRILFDQHRFAAALEAFERAVRYEPEDVSARYSRGLCLRLLDRRQEAADCFAGILRLAHHHPGATYWWARSLYEATEARPRPPADSLLAVVERTLAVHPAEDRLLAVRSELDWELGHVERARATLRILHRKRVDPAFTGPARVLTALYLGRWHEAETSLSRSRLEAHEKALVGELCDLGRALTARVLGEDPETSPEHQDWTYDLTRFLDMVGQHDLDAARRLASRSDAIPARMALLLEQPDLERALTGYQRTCSGLRTARPAEAPATLLAWALVAGNPSRRRMSSPLHWLAERVPTYLPLLRLSLAAPAGEEGAPGRRAARRIAELDVRDPDLLLETALHLTSTRHDRRRADAILNKLPKRARLSSIGRLVTARLQLERGTPRESSQTLRKLLDDRPDMVSAWVALADALEAAHRSSAAIDALEHALEATPGRQDLRLRLARMQMREGEYARARDELQRILRIDSSSVSARFNLALCLQRTGQTEAAAGEYTHVLELQSDHVAARFNRALAWERRGNVDAARQQYEQILKQRPGHERSRVRLAQLEGR